MNTNTIKIIGTIASLGGAVASLLANWADKKQLDNKIAEKVAEAMAAKQD